MSGHEIGHEIAHEIGHKRDGRSHRYGFPELHAHP